MAEAKSEVEELREEHMAEAKSEVEELREEHMAILVQASLDRTKMAQDIAALKKRLDGEGVTDDGNIESLVQRIINLEKRPDINAIVTPLQKRLTALESGGGVSKLIRAGSGAGTLLGATGTALGAASLVGGRKKRRIKRRTKKRKSTKRR